MSVPHLTKTQKKTAQAIVNVFETGRVHGDYGKVTLLPGDTGHLTYGRSQTTLASGNLALLIRAYCDAAGQFALDFVPYLPALDARDVALDHDLALRALLRSAGDDPVMREVQDKFFERVYFEPAMRSAGALGLARPLSTAIVYDSIVHGSFARIRDRVRSAIGTPADAGEKQWVGRYVSTRRQWLATHSNRLLHKTVYRMDTFQKLLGQNKWALELPLTAHGVVINQQVLSTDSTPVVASAHDAGDRVLMLTTPRMKGNDVKKVQRALGFQGKDVDGDFGPKTDLAVRQFQSQHGLSIDGKVGPATRAVLGL